MKSSYIVLSLLGAAILAGGAFYALRMRATPDVPIASSGGSGDSIAAIGGIPYWLQNDPTWATETIGGSQESMAAAGCTVTCVAMVLASLGHRTTPLELCRALKERDGFTAQGYVIWDKVTEVTQGSTRVTFPPLTYKEVDGALREGRPVIAKIMLGGTIPHWVLVVGKQGPEYVIMDPLNANQELIRLSDRSTQIYAIRVLERA